MKVIVIYKSASEHGRPVEEFMRDFTHQTGKELEMLDPETREGSALCQTYDIMQYPTLLAVDDRMNMLQMWVGLPLPRITEVSYYVEA